MTYKKGNIQKFTDSHGKIHYKFNYKKSTEKPGSIELFPSSEEIKNIFDKEPEIEVEWRSNRDFKIRYEEREISNSFFNNSSNSGTQSNDKKERKMSRQNRNRNHYQGNRQNNNQGQRINGERLIPKMVSNLISNDLSRVNLNLLLNKILWKYKNTYNDLSEKKEKFLTKFVKSTNSGDAFRKGKEFAKTKIKIFKNIGKVYREDNVETFKMSLNSRLIVGLGNPSPAETGILLHHIYGIPYIPGSALKGIARWSAIVEIAEDTLESVKSIYNNKYDIYKHFNFIDSVIESDIRDEKVAKFIEDKLPKDVNLNNQSIINTLVEKTKLARCIFGTKSSSGSILFLDAFPDENVKFKVDIMNPHYPDYYDGAKKPPADWQNPIPIPFLTVEGGKFEFVVLRTKKPEICKNEKDLLTKAVEWLEKGLTEFGVGAKTALGYGIFKKLTKELK